MNSESHDQAPINERLIDAAKYYFLNDDFHRVTTRQLATKADANISMIRYYFGNKEGLYEEMIRQTLQPLIDSLDSTSLSSSQGIVDFFKLYYKSMIENPQFATLILKVIALNKGPGKRFIYQLLERGRTRGNVIVGKLKESSTIHSSIEPELLRISIVSLAMMPMLAKNVFEEQLSHDMDNDFINKLAEFNGQLISKGLGIQ